MPPLDDLSLRLGSLMAGVEELTRQTRSLFERADDAASRMKEIEVTLTHVTSALKSIQTDMAELRSLKDRGYGVFLAVSLLAGGAGALATKLVAVIK
jgi:hypothetical protein